MTKKKDQQTKTSDKIQFEIGKVYTITVNTAIRKGPGFHYSTKKNAEVKTDGKRHFLNNEGEIEAGTPILCKEIQEVCGNLWVKCPSGWIIAYSNNNYYLG